MNVVQRDGNVLKFTMEDWNEAKETGIAIRSTDDDVPYWINFDEDGWFRSVTEVSDLDMELIDQFGEAWVNFIRAAK